MSHDYSSHVFSHVISFQTVLCINSAWLAAIDETLIPLDIIRALLRSNSSSVALRTGILARSPLTSAVSFRCVLACNPRPDSLARAI